MLQRSLFALEVACRSRPSYNKLSRRASRGACEPSARSMRSGYPRRCNEAVLRRYVAGNCPRSQSCGWLWGWRCFADHSIADVVRRLELVVADGDKDNGTVVDAALPKARYRVGDKPLEELFLLSAGHWAHEQAQQDRWRGLSVYAMDGSTLSVPDTDENREAFHLPSTGRGQSGYPKVPFGDVDGKLALTCLWDAAIGPFDGKGTAEPALARSLWDGVPEHSLLIADRNFIDYAQFFRFSTTRTERHWLVRMEGQSYAQDRASARRWRMSSLRCR